ncbi:MAG: hypothetical protein E7169_03520 [Firmicutes bacterium]|nr:hypothetical protein [Bacillota bacterium]
MLDEYKLEQPVVYQTLVNSVKKNKFSHAYLFETHGFSKSLDLVLAFAKLLLCPKNYSNNKFCGNCTQCKTIDANNYIEIKIIHPDGMWIKKEELIDLQKEFSKKALTGTKKIYIITEADKLNTASANSILKFLEEPEENIIAILMVENKYQLLDTIVSRCQIISLLNNDNKNLKTSYEKISNIINDKNLNEEKLDNIIYFINYYEKNGMDTLLNTQKLWHQYFSDKEIISDAFEIMSLYYMDALNLSCGYHLNLFDKYMKDLKEIINTNSIDSLIYKINVVLKLKELIRYNVNNNLLLDKLIIELEEAKK